MEKRVVLAIVLTIGLYVAWIAWFGPRPAPPAPPGQKPAAQGTVPATAPTMPNAGRKPDTKYDADSAATKDVTIGNSKLDLTFTPKGAALKAAEAWSCLYHDHGDRRVAGDPGQATAYVEGMPGALSVDLLGADDAPDLTQSNWKTATPPEGATSVVAEFESEGLRLTKKVTPSQDPNAPWHAVVELDVLNVSAKPGTTRTLEIVGPIQAKPSTPTETDAGILVASAGEEGEVEFLRGADVHKKLSENPKFEMRPSTGKWAWIATRADFHVGALVPTSDLPPDTTVGMHAGFRQDAPGQPAAPTAAPSFRIPLAVLPVGQTTKFTFLFYAGPNSRTLLRDENSPYHVLANASSSGGFLGLKLTWLTSLMAWLLGLLASTGIGYGASVLALTIIVRGAMFPVSRKSQISMRLHSQKMARLKPKMDAIKEKYKDAKKQQEATMKLMREEKMAMLPSGCLLPFVQMPIWIALYNVLRTTFEMRHAGFLWVDDLTSPDHLWKLPDVWFLPTWLNLLPILMMITWYASAAMQPLPPDPQQAQQAKMMRWMPVVMGLFLYGYPAGLALYMTMSAIWTIGETWLIRKLWLNKLEAALK